MTDISTVLSAAFFTLFGFAAAYFYQRQVIKDLEQGVRAWKSVAESTAQRLNVANRRFDNWKCLRPHVGDINNIDDEIKDSLGYGFDDIIKENNDEG